MRVAILTISDSSSAGTREDRAGPALGARVEELGWQMVHSEIIPDDVERIMSRLNELGRAAAADFIITTGGTGVAPRDVTPEAMRAVIEKEIPGIGERMR